MSVSEDDHLKRILQCSTVCALKAMAQKIFYGLWESVHTALLSAVRWLFLEFLFENRSLSIWNLWMSNSRHTADDVSQKKRKRKKFSALAKRYLPNPTYIQVVQWFFHFALERSWIWNQPPAAVRPVKGPDTHINTHMQINSPAEYCLRQLWQTYNDHYLNRDKQLQL